MVRQNNSSARWHLTKQRTDVFADGLVNARARCFLRSRLVVGLCQGELLCPPRRALVDQIQATAARYTVTNSLGRSQHAPAESASESQRKPSIRPTHARACMHAHTGDWFGLWTLGDGRWNNRISRQMMSDGGIRRPAAMHTCFHGEINLIESVRLPRLLV